MTMAELLVGTKKGLFVLRGEPGTPFRVEHRLFPGETVEYATRDRHSGRTLASVTSGFYGPRLMWTDDVAGAWHQADGPTFPPDIADAAVERIWVIEPAEEAGVLWAGTAPAALWRSEDGGASWQLNRSLWDAPTRPEWQAGFGGLCLHTICPWPGDPDRLAIAISAAGIWLSDDRGATWRTGYTGLVASYLPEEIREGTHMLCVHDVKRAPARPERLFMQFHNGVYRSDDAGSSWQPIAEGLPADFGFPLVVDPHDPDSAYVIPLVDGSDRVTPEGRLRMFETRDAGASWRDRSVGLPQENAFKTVLRQAFDGDAGSPQALAFGATSGEVWTSANAGATWAVAAGDLAPVTSVRFA
jgi:hypothetical protein